MIINKTNQIRTMSQFTIDGHRHPTKSAHRRGRVMTKERTKRTSRETGKKIYIHTYISRTRSIKKEGNKKAKNRVLLAR